VKILDKIYIKSRAGQLVFVELDGPEPALGSTMRRSRAAEGPCDDGLVWTVQAVEWYAISRRPGKGDKVGLLLDGPPIYVLEEIELAEGLK